MAKRITSLPTPKAAPSIPHVIIEARAGSGKSTTLVEGLKFMRGEPTKIVPSSQQKAVWDSLLLSKYTAKSVAMVAFNKSIAAELQKRVPAGCDACTMHSLGFSAVRKEFGGVKVDQYRVSNIICDKILRCDPRELRKKDGDVLRATQDLVGLCKMNLIGLNRLEHTSDRYGDSWAEDLDALASHYSIELNGSRTRVFDLVPQVLAHCLRVDEDKSIDFDDMVWLPVALGLSIRQYDLLLVDEAQDLNRCQQALAKKAGKRLILCGDPCQPPDTMVTLANGQKTQIVNLKVGDVLKSYCPKAGQDYSNRRVEGVTIRPFEGHLVEVTTENGFKSYYTPQHHCYASFGPLRDSFIVYLMKRGIQYRIGSCQLNYKSTGNGLVHRLRAEGGDAAWILEIHEAKREARLREMELSHEYGIPQVVFANGNQGYILDDEGINRFWKFVGENSYSGARVLQNYGLLRDRPVAVPGEQYQQSFKRPAIFAASNLVTGMVVRTENGEWSKITVKRTMYEGPVVSLSVSHDKLYYGDGIVTHNCQAIYGFAGADAESMPRMFEELSETAAGCVKLPLTVTRRCGKAIVAEANKVVADFQAHESNGEGLVRSVEWNGKKTKDEPAKSYQTEVQAGDMILCRVNAPLVGECFRFLKAGRKANIQGRDVARGLISTITKSKTEYVVDLVSYLSDWSHAETQKELKKRNPDDSRLIAIQDRYDCLMTFTEGCNRTEEVIQKIESVFVDADNSNKSSGILLSSVHKAKGLESERVFILMPKKGGIPHPMAKTSWAKEQEWNLWYVAVTRAISELVWVNDDRPSTQATQEDY